MKFLDKALLCGLILSLVILADARGDDPQLDGRHCRQSACQEGTSHCPILRAAECTARLSSAVDKAASSGEVILTVTPRIVIVEEEECLLEVAAAEPDCCRGGDCCAAKSACKKSNCESAAGEPCELTLKCGAKVAGKACCAEIR